MRWMVLVAAVAVTQPAKSESYTVQDGIDLCKAAENVEPGVDAGICIGLVLGISSATTYNCFSRRQGFIALPFMSSAPLPSVGAGIRTFMIWAESHPERWGDGLDHGMFAAFSERFPCKQDFQPASPAPR